MRTEVYSWRVSAGLKTGLELEAHRRKISLSALLDLAARDLLNQGGSEMESDEEQLRLHNAAIKCFGAFASDDAHRSANVRQRVRQRIRRSHDG
jgi:hypothetical protein